MRGQEHLQIFLSHLVLEVKVKGGDRAVMKKVMMKRMSRAMMGE